MDTNTEGTIQLDASELALVMYTLHQGPLAMYNNRFYTSLDFHRAVCLNAVDLIVVHDLDRQSGADGEAVVEKLARLTADQVHTLVEQLPDAGSVSPMEVPLELPYESPATDHERAWAESFLRAAKARLRARADRDLLPDFWILPAPPAHRSAGANRPHGTQDDRADVEVER